MTSSEIARLRRQMHLRIREVVAERRIARQHEGRLGGDADRSVGDNAPEHEGVALVRG